MKRQLTVLLLVIGLALISGIAVVVLRPPQTEFHVNITPTVGEQLYVARTKSYPNPGGSGNFTFRDVRFFISNIELIGKSERYQLPDSYHLISFDSKPKPAEIHLQNLPDMRITAIKLGIGVDPEANSSILQSGDLDPNSRMAWSWDVGYKFILLEGMLQLDEQQIPLVYHVGFSENYTEVTLPVADKSRSISLKADLLQFFTAREPIDMTELPTVKFDRSDAARIAEGFNHLLSVCNNECATASD